MDMYKNRRKELLHLIKTRYGGERVRFCEKTGLSESRLAQLLSETYRDGTAFTEKTARKLEQLADLAPFYFDRICLREGDEGFDGTVLTNVRQLVERAQNLPSDFDPTLVHIPKVRILPSAGTAEFDEEPDPIDGNTVAVPADWVTRNEFKRERLISIRVPGDSMEPTLYHDDFVVLNTADKSLADGSVFVANYEGEIVVRRLVRDAGEWWLTSDNTDQRRYPRKLYVEGACLLIGKVVRRESERL